MVATLRAARWQRPPPRWFLVTGGPKNNASSRLVRVSGKERGLGPGGKSKQKQQ
jgi:hypothetical protein